MKVRNVIFTCLTATGMLIGCETEPITFQGPYFVRFSESARMEKESHLEPILVEVHNAGPELNHDITINYTIGGTAREGVDYQIAGTRGKVKIDNNEFTGFIEIQLLNNANNILRSQDIILTLMSVDEDNLKIGQGKSSLGTTFTLTIQDDCILGGTYFGRRAATSVPTEGIVISSQDCEEYTLSNWDIEIFNFAEVRSLTFIDNGDNTVTVPPQEDATLPDEVATIDGSGVVNPNTREITFTIRLVDFDDQPQFTFTLTPN